jgi:MFS family permease
MIATARRGDRALFSAAFVVMAATSAVFPLLAPLQRAHHLATAGLGLIAAGPYLAGFAVQVVIGRFADRGHGRALMTCGLLLASASSFGMAISTTLAQFVIARALSGVALGAFLPTARASAADVDPREIGRQLGRLSRAELCGVIAGPVGAAALATVAGLEGTFVAFGAVGLVVAVLARPHLAQRAAMPRTPAVPAVLRLLERPAVASAVLLVVAIEFPVGMFDSMWSRYLTDQGASSLFVGLSVIPFGLPFVLLAASGGRLADRVGPARAAAVASLAVAPVIAAYAIPDSPSIIAALAVVEATFQAVAIPAARAAMAAACPHDRIAAGQGLAGAVGLSATGVAALVCPPIYAAGGAVAMCGTVAVALALTVVAAMMVGARQKPSAL